MSRTEIMKAYRFQGFPRVSGDEPAWAGWGVGLKPFSPRERG